MSEDQKDRGPLIGWKPLIRPAPEHPKEYLTRDPEELFRAFKEDVPQEFRDQAREALELIRKLDSGNTPSLDEQQRFVMPIARSGFAFISELDEGAQLPTWLRSAKDSVKPIKLTDEQKSRIENFYEEYVQEFGEGYQTEDGQTYYRYPKITPRQEREDGLDKLGNSKYYIEGQDLAYVEKVREILLALQKNGVHPHTTKLFEQDRLVLYYTSVPALQEEEKVLALAREYGVKLRGPGQDPVIITVKEDGSYEAGNRGSSNDASLGEGGWNKYDSSYRAKPYSPYLFFRSWLQLTYNGSKNPAEPYKLSFVPALVADTTEGRTTFESLAQKIKGEFGLPVVRIEYRQFSPFPEKE